MRNHATVWLTAVAAAAVLALATGSASARRFELSRSGIRITWASLEFRATGTNVRCLVTLEISFHSRTISKVNLALIGYVTRAQVGNAGFCTNGRLRFLTETLPWHVRYGRFFGSLPTIREVSIDVVNAQMSVVNELRAECLFRTEVMHPWFFIINLEPFGAITSFRSEEGGVIPLVEGPLCTIMGPITITGTGEAMIPEETGVVRIVLVQ